jgi:cellulose synthase/poly-beta-1,6-N-acetylglucosamine synthase-like glycosyltransferase
MILLTMIIQILLLTAFFWAAGTIGLGLLAGKRKAKLIAKQHCFAIIVCAHNEENVIENLLHSLADQTYDKAYYHVFLLADHCSDATASLGKKFSNVTVWERNSGARTGKGAVLHWGIELIKEKTGNKYDSYIVFDADNRATPNFVEEINKSFCSGAKLVMGNRKSLNPYSSIISSWYTIYWQTVDCLYCRPRSNLGLAAIISGTGFAFHADLLGPEGWDTTSITEDIEFSMGQNLKGVFAVYWEKAVFYDEQPTNLATMLSQVRRWCTGNFQIAAKYRKIWWKHFCAQPNLKLIDNFIPIFLAVMFGFYLILNFCWLFYNAAKNVNPFGLIDIIWWSFLYILSIGVSYAVIKYSSFDLKKLQPAILTSGIYCIIFSLIAVYSLFKPVKSWQPIEHGKTK